MSKSALRAVAIVAIVSAMPFRALADDVAPAAAVSAPPPPTETLALDLKGALELARRSAPDLAVRRARVAEAESLRAGAGVYPATNPIVDAAVGPRIVGSDTTAVVGVGISQTFELGPRVSARLRVVDAAVEAAGAESDAAALDLAHGVAVAFARALWARERLTLAADVEAIATKAADSAARKAQAGETSGLEMNIARGALARARADRAATQAREAAAIAQLKLLLGVPHATRLEPRGALDDLKLPGQAELLAAAARHPAVRAAQADLAAAQAEEDLGDALAYPELGVGVRYENEDRNVHTVLGTFSISLPIFEHGQGVSSQARAKRARAESELALRRQRLDTTARASLEILAMQREAAHAFDAEGGVEAFRDNVKLATRGFDAGETDLTSLLLLRRELIDTEAERIDRLLDLRLSEIDLLHAAGVLQ